MQEDVRLEWLRAYIAKAKQGKPYAPNVRQALMEMLDSGLSPIQVATLTGCSKKTIFQFMDVQRRQAAELRRAERGKADDREARAKALADRDARLRLMAVSCIEVDLLGSPPPGRSALDQRLSQKANVAE